MNNDRFKFRAWDKDVRKMIPWAVMISTWNFKAFQQPYHSFMQYTGLKDKNGVEIYEGDIVKAKRRIAFKSDFFKEPVLGVIRFNQSLAMFRIKTDNFDNSEGESDSIKIRHAWLNEIEVLGNIYENPELYDTLYDTK